MKQIPLTRGQYAIVDDEDFEWLSQWKWQAIPAHGSQTNFKATRLDRDTGRVFKMSRQIMGFPKGRVVDHINRNPLDNRRCNLRLATHQQNAWNRGCCGSRSGFKGVYPTVNTKSPWIANICINGKRLYLGVFTTPEEAARAYDEAAKKHQGEFAHLNFPSDQ